MQVELHAPQDRGELEHIVRHESKALRRDRARAVLLALDGLEALDIAATVARSRRFVQDSVYAYRDEGLAGLDDKRRSGAPPKLTPEEQARIREFVLKGPTETSGQTRLRGVDVIAEVSTRFGKRIGLSAVYVLLARLGLSLLHPRPDRP